MNLMCSGGIDRAHASCLHPITPNREPAMSEDGDQE